MKARERISQGGVTGRHIWGGLGGQVTHQAVEAADGNCQPQEGREGGRMTNWL